MITYHGLKQSKKKDILISN